jgi:hypothetical protein
LKSREVSGIRQRAPVVPLGSHRGLLLVVGLPVGLNQSLNREERGTYGSGINPTGVSPAVVDLSLPLHPEEQPIDEESRERETGKYEEQLHRLFRRSRPR